MDLVRLEGGAGEVEAGEGGQGRQAGEARVPKARRMRYRQTLQGSAGGQGGQDGAVQIKPRQMDLPQLLQLRNIGELYMDTRLSVPLHACPFAHGCLFNIALPACQ